MENNCCLIMAAGSGKRMGKSVKKQFLELYGMPILARTIKKFDLCGIINNIIIVAPKDNIKECESIAKKYCLNTYFSIAEGGKERVDSVRNALKTINKCDYIIIHDAVRPFITKSGILKIYECAKKYGACIPAVPVKDTVKVVDKDSFVSSTLNRDSLWAVQTPQIFKYDIIKKAYDALDEECFVTDDASVLEISGKKVKIVMGDYNNIKITTIEDMYLADFLCRMEDDNESC